MDLYALQCHRSLSSYWARAPGAGSVENHGRGAPSLGLICNLQTWPLKMNPDILQRRTILNRVGCGTVGTARAQM
jgi:hypothetical protein